MDISYKKPSFWIGFITLNIICIIYICTYFYQAFPIVNVSITLDRDQAITQAKQLAQEYHWGPQTESPFTAVSFETDNTTKTFIELEGGGQNALLNMMSNHWYEPYLWHVRLFDEFNIEEVSVYFTPDGKRYEFEETIADITELPSLKKSEALTLVLKALTDDWSIDITPYELIEASKQIKPNNRIDRTFVFERSDITLRDGRYRIKAVVSGNKLTEIKRFIKVPESFTLQYKQMRSYNDAIAYAGAIFAFIFYLLLGSIIGLFLLLRINWVIWQTPIKWALLIATLNFLMTFNTLPLLWMDYKTESSMMGFLLQIIIKGLHGFFTDFVIVALAFTTAESLTRRAFAHHIRLWDSWSKNIGNSFCILGRTIGGYLMVSIFLAFSVTFYMLSSKFLGWWSPIGNLADPDILANYLPWFSSVAISLEAGFLEECKFRAIPLATAALIGERFGNKKWWIGAAFILQAIVFGAAHANYPSEPAIARLVELIIPSFIFGGIYLRFGLITGIIAHYSFDVVLFALPIFFSHAWLNTIAVIFCILIPLWIVIYRRIQQHQWVTLTTTAFNGSWQPVDNEELLLIDPKEQIIKPLEHTKRTYLMISAIVGLIAWALYTPFQSVSPKLKLYKDETISIAHDNMLKNAPELSSSYKPYVQVKPTFKETDKNELQHSYIWQTYGKEVYQKLLGSYLKPARMVIRFLRFDGSLVERAQEYAVSVGAPSEHPSTYSALNWQHKIPEQIAGANLIKKEARAIAEQGLIDHGYQLEDLYERKAKPQQLPDRKDWIFTFGNKTDVSIDGKHLKKGELLIIVAVSGDKLTRIEKKVHVPQQYKRNKLNIKRINNVLQQLYHLLVSTLFIFCMILGLVYWAKKRFSTSLFLCSLLVFILLFAITLFNGYPNSIAQFNTQAPFINQLLKTYLVVIQRYLLRAFVFAFTFSLIIAYRPGYNYKSAYENIATGMSAGIIIQAIASIIELYRPSIEPVWAGYKGAGTLSPMLGFILYYLPEYFTYAIGLTLCLIIINYITDYGKRYFALALLGSIIACLTMTGMQSFEIPLYWIISSLILGTAVTIVWYLLLRFSYTAIFFAVATGFALNITQQMMFNVIPNNWLAGGATIVIIFYVAFHLSKLSMRYQEANRLS